MSESLKDGGIFIFDINTPYKYEVLMADNTIAENRDEAALYGTIIMMPMRK